MKYVIALVAMFAGCGGDSIHITKDMPTGAGGASSAASSGSGGTGGSSQGAGGSSTCECDNGSGTRLRSTFYVGADDSRFKVDGLFFDPTLGVQCTMAMAIDGVNRCLPIVRAAVHSQFFSDSTCKIPLGVLSKASACLQAPKYAHEPISIVCGNATRIYPVALPFNGIVYSGAAGCTQVDPTQIAQFYLYTLGQSIDPTMFVPFTESNE